MYPSGRVVQQIDKPAVSNKNPEGRIVIGGVQEAHLRRAGPQRADDARKNGHAAADAAGADPVVVIIVSGVDGTALAGIGQRNHRFHHAAAGTGIDRAALAGVGQGDHRIAAGIIAGAGIDGAALTGVGQRNHRIVAGVIDRAALAGIGQGNRGFVHTSHPPSALGHRRRKKAAVVFFHIQ